MDNRGLPPQTSNFYYLPGKARGLSHRTSRKNKEMV